MLIVDKYVAIGYHYRACHKAMFVLGVDHKSDDLVVFFYSP
jgi:hypothetical protein